MNQPIPERHANFSCFRWLLAAAMLFCAGVLGHSIFVVSQGVDFLVRHVTIDDTYYYLNTAWYTRQMGFVTFDGVNPTNGVQFLWFWGLYLCSFLFDSREAFLTGSFWLMTGLNLLAIPLTMWLGQLLWDWRGAILAGSMALFLVCQNKFLMMGLENTIHLVVFLLVSISYLKFLTLRRPGWYLATMALLALNVWGRLDAAAVSAIVGIQTTIVLLRCRRLTVSRRMAILATAVGICTMAAGILFWGNHRMGGSVVPVSGLWKNASTDWAAVLPTFHELWGRTLPAVFPVDRITPDKAEFLVAFLLSVAVAILEVRSWRRRESPLALGVLVLLGALLVHTIILSVAVESSHALRGIWYQSPHFALMMMLVVRLVSRIPKRTLPRYQRVSVPTFVTGFLVVAIALLAAKGSLDFVDDHDETNLHGERLQLARWVRDNTPAEARLAAFNTGELGFFSERRATNLDGLINSFEYYQFRRGGGRVLDYLDEQGIDYFVDYTVPEEVISHSTLIHEHPLPERPPIQVRRMEFSRP